MLALPLTPAVAPGVWAADDLGMEILWSSDARGRDVADWEVPVSASPGAYRFLISAKRYSLSSATFAVGAGASVIIPAGGARDAYGNSNRTALRLR
jgi:hypothetical protein